MEFQQKIGRIILCQCIVYDGDKLEFQRLSSLIELNNLGVTKEAATVFGSAQNLIDAFYKLQKNLYSA
jgi:hypothetical protein